MRFTFTHHTCYSFSRPVFLEPHWLRLVPRQDLHHDLLSFDMDIRPAPAGKGDQLDAEGNAVSVCWFEGLHDVLEIVARGRVETRPGNPFGFLPPTPPPVVPLDKSARGRLPGAVRLALDRPEPSEAATGLGDEIAATGAVSPIDFCVELCRYLHHRFRVIARWQGPAYSPEQTLAQEGAACRDLAVLMMDICRSQFLPARFVSGYFYDGNPETHDELHAWTEVFIPGGGWIGFDPTQGLLAGEYHVPLCASVQSARTMPVTGTFRGSGVTSALKTKVHLEED